jgi:hypothetical protein
MAAWLVSLFGRSLDPSQRGHLTVRWYKESDCRTLIRATELRDVGSRIFKIFISTDAQGG